MYCLTNSNNITYRNSNRLIIPAITHWRNDIKGNNNYGAAKITIDVTNYNTLTIGSVNKGVYACHILADNTIYLDYSGTYALDISKYSSIQFSVTEPAGSVTIPGGEFGFFNIVFE